MHTLFWWGNLRPLGRSRHRREDIMKVDLQEVVAETGLIWLRIGTGGELL